MCMYDGSEPAQVLSEGKRTARKEHQCEECRRIIAPGETYYFTSSIYDGYFSMHKCCAHCRVAQDWLGKECRGWVYSMMREDITEHIREAPRGAYGMPLARLAVGMRRKWTTIHGTLMNLPQMPAVTP